MAEPFIGEIKMFAGNFAPQGFAFCDGQLLAISQNEALFSLLGTIYGGDGQTAFALPDLRGRIPVHMGNGPGLSLRMIGSKGGNETVTLTAANLPSHAHGFAGSADAADSKNPKQRVPAVAAEAVYGPAGDPPASMGPSALEPTGGGQPHPNMQPFQCLNFIIALFGIYPSRN
jgi:microcystin-dependent protein